MSREKQIITQTPPSLAGTNNVQFNKKDFNAAIYNKGYDVYIEKAFICPCRSKDEKGGALSSCRNCGGVGFVFINKFATRLLMHSMNLNRNYSEVGVEDKGTVNITAMDSDRLGIMDRITIIDGISVHNQLLFPKLINSNLFAYSDYNIKEVLDVFLFESESLKLKRLLKDIDYTFEHNKFILDVQYHNLEDPCLSIKFIHSPVYHVIDMVRNSMNTNILNAQGAVESIQMPVSAIGRPAHFVLDAENFIGNRLLDNSYLTPCDVK